MKIFKTDIELDLKFIEVSILFSFFQKRCFKNSTFNYDLGETIFQIELFVSAFAQHSLSLHICGNFIPNITT